MPRYALQNLSGWGRVPIERCRVYRPEKGRQLHELVRRRPFSLISRGLGRSYGDAALNRDRAVVLHERLDRMIAFDPQTNVLEAEAGVSLDAIIHVFLRRGLFLPVTPGTRFVTLGGAIAANVHGKNQHRDGSFGSCVEQFRLLTASGDVVSCSRNENAGLFRATLGGMGLTGMIVSARVRLMPVESAYLTVHYHKLAHLDNLLARMGAEDHRHRYSVAWIDCLATGRFLGRAVLMHGDHAAASDLPAGRRNDPLSIRPRRRLNVPVFMPGWLLNARSVGAFNRLYYARHRSTTTLVDYDSFFYPLDSIGHWNRLYGRRGFVQYQMVLPPQSSRRGLVRLLEKLAASRRASFLAVLKTFGPGDDGGPLSFPMAGHTLALDMAHTGPELFELLDQLDRIVLDHGGRVYLAKDARMSRQTFEAMYPQAEVLKQLRATVDPHETFSSSLARRLGLADDKPAEPT